MILIKIVSLGILISTVVVIVKQVKPELAIAVSIAGCVILLSIVFNYFFNIFNVFNEIVTKTGLDIQLFIIILKIIGVGYLVEFSADICLDSGNNAIADKIILCGKILIFVMALPIITNLFEIILGLIM